MLEPTRHEIHKAEAVLWLKTLPLPNLLDADVCLRWREGRKMALRYCSRQMTERRLLCSTEVTFS